MTKDLVSKLQEFNLEIERRLKDCGDNFNKNMSKSLNSGEYASGYFHAEINTYQSVKKLLQETFQEITSRGS